jgi:hypothetical protein
LERQPKIRNEQKVWKTVYIIISLGNKLSAITGTIAALINKEVIPYYSKVKKIKYYNTRWGV